MYQASSKIIQSVLDGKGDLKTMLYRENKVPNSAVYALATQTLKYKHILDEIIVATPTVSKQYNHHKNKSFRGLILVLIYELLFGTKKSKLSSVNSGRFTKLILNNKQALNSALVRIKIKKNVSNNKDLIFEINDKSNTNNNCISNNYIYARINTILITYNNIITQLITNHKFKFCNTEPKENENENENKKAFWNDKHIRNLLVFTYDCCIAKLQLCLEGYLIIQNKSSCIPPFVLNPTINCTILDACAAPGNKTSHLINIISDNYKNKNKKLNLEKRKYVTALDYDRKRYNILSERIKLFGMNNYINVLNLNFLSIDPLSEFANKFNYILLDPSCSGSGLINNRLGHYNKNKQLKIPKFAAIQKEMILHAMKFKNVNKIVYSTCSINEEENEKVIEFVLNNCNNKFELIKIFNEWNERGINKLKYKWNDCVVRINNNNKYNLHGFFVACFQRISLEINNKKRKLASVATILPSKCQKLNNNNKKWKVRIKRAKHNVRKQWKKK